MLYIQSNISSSFQEKLQEMLGMNLLLFVSSQSMNEIEKNIII